MTGTTKKTLAEALIEFQKDLPSVGLDGDNPHFKSKFATLGNVTNETFPELTAVGLAYTVGSYVEDGLLIVDAHLLHESGESRSMQIPIHATDPQKVGSAITYFRRYALGALTGVVADADDDGNTASQQTVGEKRAAAQSAPKPAAPQGEPKSAKDKIRVHYIETGKVTKEEINSRYDTLKGAGTEGVKAFEQILKDLEAEK